MSSFPIPPGEISSRGYLHIPCCGRIPCHYLPLMCLFFLLVYLFSGLFIPPPPDTKTKTMAYQPIPILTPPDPVIARLWLDLTIPNYLPPSQPPQGTEPPSP